MTDLRTRRLGCGAVIGEGQGDALGMLDDEVDAASAAVAQRIRQAFGRGRSTVLLDG